MSRWTEVDNGLTDTGAAWRVGLVAGRLTICVDKVTVRPADADRFAEAVARAVTPGRAARAAITHIATDPDDHRRHGCPTCLAEPGYAERRAAMPGQPVRPLPARVAPRPPAPAGIHWMLPRPAGAGATEGET
jgi:hypothetical protein